MQVKKINQAILLGILLFLGLVSCSKSEENPTPDQKQEEPRMDDVKDDTGNDGNNNSGDGNSGDGNSGDGNADPTVYNGINPFKEINIGNARATPSFYDFDEDGDADLILGNDFNDKLEVYENNGQWKFEGPKAFTPSLVDNGPNPTFANIVGDEKLELIIGNRDGIFKSYSLVEGQFKEREGINNLLRGINVQAWANPEFTNVDSDGTLELLTSAKDGTIRVYDRQFSNYTSSTFKTLKTELNQDLNFGDEARFAVGDLNGDGLFDIIVGNQIGKMWLYYQIKDLRFKPAETNPFKEINLGNALAPELFDIDKDGDLDLIIGTIDGQLGYFHNNEGKFEAAEGNPKPLG